MRSLANSPIHTLYQERSLLLGNLRVALLHGANVPSVYNTEAYPNEVSRTQPAVSSRNGHATDMSRVALRSGTPRP